MQAQQPPETQQEALARQIAAAVCTSLSIRDANLITNVTNVVAKHQNDKNFSKLGGEVYAKTPQLTIPKIGDPATMNIEHRVRSFIRYREDLCLYFTAAYKHGSELFNAMSDETDKVYKAWLMARSEDKDDVVNKLVQQIAIPELASMEEFNVPPRHVTPRQRN